MRVKSGVEGFDAFLDGGFPKGSSIILQGPSGVEKELFYMHFLKEGFDSGESIIVVLSTKSPEKFKYRLSAMGLNIDELLEQKRLAIIDWYSHKIELIRDVQDEGSVLKPSADLTNVSIALEKALSRVEGKGVRAVVEVLSPALKSYSLEDVYKLAQGCIAKLDKRGATSLFLLEKEMHDSVKISTLQQPFDGVVDIVREKVGDNIERKIGILSMKDSDIPSSYEVLSVKKNEMWIGKKKEQTIKCPSCSAPVKSSTEFCPKCKLPIKKYLKRLFAIEKKTRLKPDDINSWLAKGILLSEMHIYEKALACFNTILKLDEKCKEAWNAKADVFTKLGKYNEAAECYKKALEFAYAQTDSTHKDVLAEEKAIEKILEELVEDELEEKYSKELDVYEERLKKNPKDVDALFSRALVLNNMGRHRDAMNALHAVTRLDFKHPKVWKTKGDIFKKLGDYKKATICYKRAQEFIPKRVACPLCGSFVLSEAAECPKCGVEFEGELKEEVKEPSPPAVLKPKPTVPPRPKQRKPEKERGLTNGLIREKVIGERAGKVNGLVNGRGRTNGLINGTRAGKVNGLVNGKGRINGLINGTRAGKVNGLVNGRGRINGLINGTRAGKVNGLVNGRGRINGLINGTRAGKVNGLVNGKGRINGLINGTRAGKVNGLVNGKGRINGLINGTRAGKVNGLVNGEGRINGLINGIRTGRINGIINGFRSVRGGLTNGLTNGMGLTNGLGSHRFNKETTMNRWKMCMIPLIAMALLFTQFMMPPGEKPVYNINIDGDFADWNGLTTSVGQRAALNPNIDIFNVGVKNNKDYLSFYIETKDSILEGGNDMVDTFYIFIDYDLDYDTGYKLNHLGADYLVFIYGKNGNVMKSSLKVFDDSRGQNDWSGWSNTADVSAAANGNKLETQVDWEALGGEERIVEAVFYSQSYAQEEDFADYITSNAKGILNIKARSVATEIITGTDNLLLELELTAIKADMKLTELEIELLGTAETSELSKINLFSQEEGLLAERIPISKYITFRLDTPLEIAEDSTKQLVVTADVKDSSGHTLGASIQSPRDVKVEEGIVSIEKIPSANELGYLGFVPTETTIDGGFSDWQDSMTDSDTSTVSNPNINIQNYNTTTYNSNIYFYLSVEGNLMNGTLVPFWNRVTSTVTPPGVPDSDLDGMPDDIDPYPYDFDNNGILDSDTNNDVDEDGIQDHPYGGDYWLNTTIPNTTAFPADHMGKNVSAYIGPRAQPVVTGEDTVYIYIDNDRNAATGYRVNSLGADYMVSFSGKNGEVLSTSYYKFNSTQGKDSWIEEGNDVPVETNSRRLEAKINPAKIGLNLGDAFDMTYRIVNWNESVEDYSWAALTETVKAVDLFHLVTGVGADGGDRFGWNVSYAGDVNNDGYTDIIVGAPYNDTSDGSKADAGAAYIFFGYPGISSNDINAVNANVSIYGSTAGDLFGWSVSDAGDVNGGAPAYDDIIIGAPGYGTDKGRGYVFYGRTTGSWSSVDDADTDADVNITGESDGDKFSSSVSGAGDVNNDNYDDVIVGAYGYGTDQGRAYIFYGPSFTMSGISCLYTEDIAEVELAATTIYTDYLILTVNPAVSTNYLIIAASDVGPDDAAGDFTSLRLRIDDDDAKTYHNVTRQFDDATDWYHFSAMKYITLAAGSYDIELEYKTGGATDTGRFRNTRIIAIEMTIPADQYAEDENTVESTGDPTSEVTAAEMTFTPASSGDYLVIASANVFHDNNADSAWGRMYIDGTLYGEMLIEPDDVDERMNFGVFKNVTLDASSHTINLTVQNDDAGATIASMNHAHIVAIRLDTFSESHYNEAEGQNDGTTGSTWETLVTNSYTPTTDGDFIILGTAEWFSNDINNLRGIRLQTASTTRQESRLENQDVTDRHMTFQMDKRALSGAQSDTVDQNIPPEGWSKFARLIALPVGRTYVALTGENANDRFGFSVSNAGNVNNDNFDDVIVGAPYYDDGGNSDAGKAYIFNGSSSSSADILSSETYPQMTGGAAGDHFGWSVANCSDINTDGSYDDVIVGAPDTTNGNAYIYYGGDPMDNTADVTLAGENSGDKFGFSVHSAGDIGGDGLPDVVVGAPYYDNGALTDAGIVYIFNGSSSMDSTADYIHKGEQANEHLGWSVSLAGNMGGAYNNQVVTGAPDHDDGANTDAGEAEVLCISEHSTIVIPITAIVLLFIGVRRRRKRRKSTNSAAQ